MVFRSCFSLFTQPFTLSPQASHDQSLLTPPDRMERNDAEPELKAGCIFCDVSVENGFSLVETTNDLIAFHDRSPGSSSNPIATVKHLRREHIPLLTKMEEMGHRLLNERSVPVESRRLGFHIPPFSSVHHLHLHVLSLPLSHTKAKIKYRPTSFHSSADKLPASEEGQEAGHRSRGKRWGWFVDVRDVKAILDVGERVKIAAVKV